VVSSNGSDWQQQYSEHLRCCCSQLDLRNNGLRKKYDTLKYTLKKLEVAPPLPCRWLCYTRSPAAACHAISSHAQRCHPVNTLLLLLVAPLLPQARGLKHTHGRCCAVLCCAVLCCAVLCCTVLYCTVLHYIIPADFLSSACHLVRQIFNSHVPYRTVHSPAGETHNVMRQLFTDIDDVGPHHSSATCWPISPIGHFM
jgi:hypothetical protein